MWPYLRLRSSRGWRRFKRETNFLSRWTLNYFRRRVWGRWGNLLLAKSLILPWLLLTLFIGVLLLAQIVGLDNYYLTQVPAPGGDYSEGLVGKVRVINPILALDAPSLDLDRLIFSGLTQFNSDRGIVPDLAESWDESTDGRTYTFHLRPDAVWQDGVPLTASDVAFTLDLIQNPDARSPLASSWQGVKSQVVDNYTLKLILPNPYAPFINLTTFGILPRHTLDSIAPANLLSAEFNTAPVGSGPYKLKQITPDGTEFILAANTAFYGRPPRLDNITIRTYTTAHELMNAYARKEILGLSTIQRSDLEVAKKLPDLTVRQLTVPDYTTLFFNLKRPIFGDQNLRAGLALATDRGTLISRLFGSSASAAYDPIPPGYPGYNPAAPRLKFNAQAATQKLDAAGWTLQGGVRTKDGNPLKLQLVTHDDPDYRAVATEIQRQWQAVGVQLDIVAASTDDLQQRYIRPRNYDILLYGINLGADPDVYGFWHSSQAADPGLNLSGYSSADADKYLESGRIVRDPVTRAAKYQKFEAIWAADVPAIFLYTPTYYYGVDRSVGGVTAQHLVYPSDRFYNIESWYVNTATVIRKR